MEKKESFIRKMQSIYNKDDSNYIDNIETINTATELEKQYSNVEFDNVLKEINVSEEEKASYSLVKDFSEK